MTPHLFQTIRNLHNSLDSLFLQRPLLPPYQPDGLRSLEDCDNTLFSLFLTLQAYKIDDVREVFRRSPPSLLLSAMLSWCEGAGIEDLIGDLSQLSEEAFRPASVADGAVFGHFREGIFPAIDIREMLETGTLRDAFMRLALFPRCSDIAISHHFLQDLAPVLQAALMEREEFRDLHWKDKVLAEWIKSKNPAVMLGAARYMMQENGNAAEKPVLRALARAAQVPGPTATKALELLAAAAQYHPVSLPDLLQQGTTAEEHAVFLALVYGNDDSLDILRIRKEEDPEAAAALAFLQGYDEVSKVELPSSASLHGANRTK